MDQIKTYHIVTFGCAQNVSDSERIAALLQEQGMKRARNIGQADEVIINTCMVREMAENRVYGLVNNLTKNNKQKTINKKIILTGCMVGMAVRDKSGKFLRLLKKRMPTVDEFLPIEEIGFDHPPLRSDTDNAWVPISNGCNNFCTFCVVPFTRGREISRPYEEIIAECQDLAKRGYKKITLLGMNVNSYGADLILGSDNIQVMRDIGKTYFKNPKSQIPNPKQIQNPNNQNSKQRESLEHLNLRNSNLFRISDLEFRISNLKPIYVKHLGRYRIPTLFPYLLEDICKIEGIERVDFMSSNPWDFSDELIEVIASNKKITRQIHLPVQSGSNTVLKRMNRWYTREDYIGLIRQIRGKVPKVEFSTDIIVGFCGETEEEFLETVDLAEKAGFYKAYIAMYSDRPMTAAHKAFADDVPHKEKKRRWFILENLINKQFQR
jgi:tRNA-2-methylthio-N6-dimethylallyladenosine synthase